MANSVVAVRATSNSSPSVPTLLEIKTLAASYLDRSPSDFTINGQDMWLLAANQVRKSAELEHDFEFNRKLVTVTVNGTTGGDLGAAVDADSGPVTVKTVLEAGLLDEQNNLIPVEWTTVAESLERQRGEERYCYPRYPSDNWKGDVPYNGLSRFTFSGNQIRRWPKTTDSSSQDFNLWLEVYSFDSDWTTANLASDTLIVTGTITPDATGTYTYAGLDANSNGVWIKLGVGNPYIINNFIGQWQIAPLAGSESWTLASGGPAGSYTHQGTATGTAVVSGGTPFSGIWTTYGQQYLLWGTIVQLNKLFKVFVPRQEGNLPPPTDLMTEGLQTLVDWDANKFEQFRRHLR